MAEEFDTGTIGTIGTIAVPCSHTSCMMLHVPTSCTSEGSHLHVLLGFDSLTAEKPDKTRLESFES